MYRTVSNGQAFQSSPTFSWSKAGDPVSLAILTGRAWVISLELGYKYKAGPSCMQHWAAWLCSKHKNHTACDSKAVGNFISFLRLKSHPKTFFSIQLAIPALLQKHTYRKLLDPRYCILRNQRNRRKRANTLLWSTEK